MSGILLILLIIGFIYWRKTQKQNSSSIGISVETEGLDDGTYKRWRQEDKIFSNTIYLDEEKLKKELNGRCRKKISDTFKTYPKPVERFRGYEYKPDPEEDEWEYWEGYYNEWRREICSNEDIILEFQMWDFCRNYYLVDQDQMVTSDELLDSRGQMKYEMLKIMRDDFFKKWKKQYYNKENKIWEDFDIDRIYFQTRSLMIGRPDFPIPNYIWLMDDRPFIYSYRLTRDYMKWKGTKRVTKIVFDNIVKWETGTIFKEDERETKELYNPLWVDWNIVGKDLLLMKTKLKKEDKGGNDWLKTDVKDYINSRVSFYENLGETSKYKINDELLSKFEKLK